MKLEFPWNEKKDINGTIDEILDELKKIANSSCSRCHGLGHLGYTTRKVKLDNGKELNPRTYIPCPKCVEDKLVIHPLSIQK